MRAPYFGYTYWSWDSWMFGLSFNRAHSMIWVYIGLGPFQTEVTWNP